MVELLTDATFADVIEKETLPVLVDCYADWCGPCKMMAPTVDALADKMAGQLRVCKVNVDDSMGIARKYGIMSIPTFMVFKDGALVKTIVGGMMPDAFEAAIREAIA